MGGVPPPPRLRTTALAQLLTVLNDGGALYRQGLYNAGTKRSCAVAATYLYKREGASYAVISYCIRAGILKLGGVKASQGGREHDSDILMKSSSELQSNLVTTSLLIHYIRICDLVLKNNFVWTLIRYCFNFRRLIYIDTSLYASPSFLRGRCHLARRFCTFSFIRSFLSHAVKPYFPNFLKVHERDSLLTLLWSGQYLVVFS